MHPAFQVHMLNNGGRSKAGRIAEAFDNLLNELLAMNGPSREMSIVATKLEEACFFAKKGMAQHPDNQI